MVERYLIFPSTQKWEHSGAFVLFESVSVLGPNFFLQSFLQGKKKKKKENNFFWSSIVTKQSLGWFMVLTHCINKEFPTTQKGQFLLKPEDSHQNKSR